MSFFEKLFNCKKVKSISFLLGAGFSAPKGYPIGNQLNEKLLNCTVDDFAFANDGHLVTNIDGTKPDLGSISHYDLYFKFCIDLMHFYNDIIKVFDYEEFYDYFKNEAKNDSALNDFFLRRSMMVTKVNLKIIYFK